MPPDSQRSLVGHSTEMLSSLAGIPLYGSRYVPEGQIVRVGDSIHFHERPSIRARRRRPHGRRNGPRRWKVNVVTYRPDYDRIATQVQKDGAA